MNNPANNSTQTDYTSRINAVFDYIEKHIDKDMSLDELAKVACFSKYHFSRIFDAMVGETPFEFIKRIRLEKAATRLRLYPDETVTGVALEYGFNDLAVFSRNFSDFFGMSPTEWQKENRENSNHNQIFDSSDLYLATEQNRNHNMESLQSTEVRDILEKTVAYIRHTGPYKGDKALFNRLFDRLFAWAGPRGLTDRRNADPLVIYHDDPCVTEKDKLRMSICLPVPPDTAVDGEIGKMEADEPMELTIHHIITHGKEASVDGEMKTADGQVYAFCDVYKFSGFKNPKITEMTSYAIDITDKQ